MLGSSARRDVRQILSMLFTIALPAAITLHTVHTLPGNANPAENPSPHGYTESLLLFVFPVIVLTIAHAKWTDNPVHRRALLWASMVIAALGFVLDLAFGYTFFTFENPGAVLGIRAPSLDLSTWHWVSGYLPIEEFAFYIFGALFVLMFYLWLCDRWLRLYEPDAAKFEAQAIPKLVDVSLKSLGLWAALVAFGVWYKFNGPHPQGFPGYWLFIMILGFLPSFLFLKPIAKFVNWRAFAFAYASLVLVSLTWEATLGVPYNWWNYHHDQMIGIDVLAWSDLPIEAVLLWLVIAWDCVIALEIFTVFFHMERKPRAALFGQKAAAPAAPAGPA